MDLLSSPTLASLPPHLLTQVQQFTQQHIQEHTMQMQAMMSLVKKLGGGEAGGKGTTEQSANNSESQGTSNTSGMDHTGGPLASALDSQRAGKGGSYSPNSGQQ